MSDKSIETINDRYYTGERPLFNKSNLQINNTIFGEGESPLKESDNIELKNSSFQWKYPLWYAKDIVADNCTWAEMARAGVWYTDNLLVRDTLIEAPKNFRRCRNLTLSNVFMPNAAETLWNCDGVTMEKVSAKGDYFAMNSKNMGADLVYAWPGAEIAVMGAEGAVNIAFRRAINESEDKEATQCQDVI